ncbi:MAG: 50S ribosomal protein L37ae [Halobacteriales archaeon]
MPNEQQGAGSAGRYGARYGRVSRRRVSEIEADTRDDHACPECGAETVDRDGTGIWTCRRCDHSFTGGAYRPETPGGRDVQRSIRAALTEDEDE